MMGSIWSRNRGAQKAFRKKGTELTMTSSLLFLPTDQQHHTGKPTKGYQPTKSTRMPNLCGSEETYQAYVSVQPYSLRQQLHHVQA